MNEPSTNGLQLDTADKILASLANLDEAIANAPDEPTPEDVAATAQQRATEALAARQASILSPAAGWFPKTLYDVQNVPLRGSKWHLAFEDVTKIVQSNGIVIIHGPRGPGKTRMAAEIAVATGQGTYRRAMDFFLAVRASYKPKSEIDEADVIDELIAPRLLVIDELQVRGGSKFEDNLLTHLIDSRYASMKPTILIGNLTGEQLAENLGASIVDRLRENGAVILCDWPSFRTPQQ